MNMSDMWDNLITGALSVLGSLGLLSLVIKGQNEKINSQDSKIEQSVLKREHDLLCLNSTLLINAHITKEMSQLKDEVFEELRKINAKISNT